MTHVVLDSPGILTIVGELVANTMTQHMWVDREFNLGLFPRPGNHLAYSGGRHRTTPFSREDVGIVDVPSSKAPQRAQLVTSEWMH
jgi:hypothetical protein